MIKMKQDMEDELNRAFESRVNNQVEIEKRVLEEQM